MFTATLTCWAYPKHEPRPTECLSCSTVAAILQWNLTKITNAVTKLLNVCCRKKRQTLEESVTRLFVAHVNFSEKLLAANDRYHSRKINLGNKVQCAVKTPKFLEKFSFLRLMETLIMTNVFAGYKSLWSGKSVRCRMLRNLFCLTRENFPRDFTNKEGTHIYSGF
jgi:hypothetical protein